MFKTLSYEGLGPFSEGQRKTLATGGPGDDASVVTFCSLLLLEVVDLWGSLYCSSNPDPLYLYKVTRLELMGQLRHGEGHRVCLMNSSLDLLQGL